jgi:NAD/NADP transhydrogenase beta subunit
MTTLDIVTFFVYLAGSVTFILGLKFLASPVSARGNRLAATGMAIVSVGSSRFAARGGSRRSGSRRRHRWCGQSGPGRPLCR